MAIWKNGAAHLVPNALGTDLTSYRVSLDEDGSVPGRDGCAQAFADEPEPERGVVQTVHRKRTHDSPNREHVKRPVSV